MIVLYNFSSQLDTPRKRKLNCGIISKRLTYGHVCEAFFLGGGGGGLGEELLSDMRRPSSMCVVPPHGSCIIKEAGTQARGTSQ